MYKVPLKYSQKNLIRNFIVNEALCKYFKQDNKFLSIVLVKLTSIEAC